MAANTVLSTQDIGYYVATTRKQQALTQHALAAMSGVGVRFIVDLEKGKATCEIGKVLLILQALGIQMVFENR